jgi:lipoprotein NlpI
MHSKVTYLLLSICLQIVVFPTLAGARQSDSSPYLQPKALQDARAYFERASARQKHGNLDGALEDYNQVLKLDPKAASAYNRIAMIKRAKGDLNGALADCNRAIELKPQFAVAYDNRGIVKMVQRDFEGALSDFNRAIELEPTNPPAYNNRALVRVAKGDLDGAGADYDSALQCSVASPRFSIYTGLSTIKEVKGDLDGALTDAEKAVELGPHEASAYYHRGSVRGEIGDLDGALADLRHILQLEPQAPNSDYIHAGIWCLRSKKHQEKAASEELAAYLAQRPANAGNDWSMNVCRFLLDQMSEADLRAAAAPSDTQKGKDQHCEYWYYAGLKKLLAGDKEAAAQNFRECVATKVFDFGEYHRAQAELKALTH